MRDVILLKCTVLHAIEHCYNIETSEYLLVIECGSRTFPNFFELYYIFTLVKLFRTLN